MDCLLLCLVLESRARGLVRSFQLCLDLPELPPGEHLYVGADLLPRPCLARPQLDVPRYQLVPSIHLPLVRQDDLPSPTGWIYGQGLHETLLNLRSPNTFSVLIACVLVVVELARVVLCDLRADRFRHSRKPNCIVSLQTYQIVNKYLDTDLFVKAIKFQKYFIDNAASKIQFHKSLTL